jgi:hypothetical protein
MMSLSIVSQSRFLDDSNNISDNCPDGMCYVCVPFHLHVLVLVIVTSFFNHEINPPEN